MLKEILPTYPILSDSQMLNGVTSLPSNIAYKDDVSYEVSWTGTPTGSFSIQGSNSYSPGLPQGGGPATPGVWTDLPFPASFTAVAGAPGSILFNLTLLAFKWIRLSYTSTDLVTGSGLVTAYVTGKSIG